MRYLRKVHFQHIGLDDIELPVLAQPRGQVAVQLDHREPAQAFDQRLGQRRQPRADLHHGLPGLGRDGAHNRIDDALVAQEVLAEALARDVLHCGASRYST